ncbi:MAG: hypothetical protein Fues2KO_14000 [Fuerstiella sp.]
MNQSQPADQESPDVSPDELAQLRAILDSAVDGVITIDEHGLMEAVNPAAEQLFGYKAAEMLGRNVNMLMPAPFAAEHDSYLANYLRTGHRSIIGIGREVEGRRKDGQRFPLYLAVSETRLGHRRVFTGFLHDLTDLRSAEARATELGRILEDSVNEIFIFDAQTLNFLLVNQGALRNIGYTAAEMKRLTPADIKPNYSREQFQYLLNSLDETKDLLEFETVHQRRDGSVYDVLVRLQKTSWRGRPAYVAIIVDVTQRRQQESDLRIRNRAIQAAGEGIVILDAEAPDHRIVFVNAAFEAITGYASTDVVGHDCRLLFQNDSNNEAFAGIKLAMSNQREFQTTLQCARHDGRLFWNEVSLAPVHEPDGTISHFVAVMQDVTKQRQAEQERLQSERLAAIGQMVAGLAHESRNALQRAQACLDLLALEVEDHPDQLDLTQKVHRALSDLHRHYEEVRNYAAPIVLERRFVSLAGIWRSTWRDLESLRGLSSFELTLPTIPDDQLICQVDEHRIQQVFCNIIENSLTSCGEQGRLSIDVEELSQDDQSWYRIIFQDDGPGFDPETARQAFQPFFTTRQKGTGLGLAICRRIVEAHGGHMQINVDCCDGAEIEVLLPKKIRSDNQDVAKN